MSTPYVDAVRAHVQRTYPELAVTVVEWTEPRWRAEHPDFRVLECHVPGDEDGGFTYVSAGAAHLRTYGDTGHEYVIDSPVQERLMVELLVMVASYATRPDHDGLHGGHTVPIGGPWIDGAEADHLYLSVPVNDPPEFERLVVDGFTTNFLWLVPITKAEADWRHAHGREAFEQLLHERKVAPADPARRSVV